MRKNTCKRLLSLLLALLMILALAACGGGGDSPATQAPQGGNTGDNNTGDNNTPADNNNDSNTPADNGGEEVEQVLNLRLNDLNLLDVNDARNANEFLVLTAVQEGLFRTFTDENGNDVTEYAGCTSYDVSDDGLTYTFHLREGCEWSDGVPVTAQNYVDSWLRLVDPNEAFSYAFLATGIAGAEAYYNGEGSVDDVQVHYIDDLTFSCTLADPDPAFIKKAGFLAFYPIRKDLIDAAVAAGQDWTNDYTLHVFNGPFIISDRVRENSMTLTKNEHYWDKDNIHLTQVNMRVVDEAATVAQLVESQQMDIVTLTDMEYVEKWQPLVDNGTLGHITQSAPSVTYLVVDQHPAANGGPSGLMLNEKCRLAMSLAFDREEYNDMFYSGYNTVAYSLIPFNIVVGDTEYRSKVPEQLKNYEDMMNDPAQLRALFEEGMVECGMSGNAEDAELLVFTSSSTVAVANQLEWFKQQLESKIGCKVKIETYPDTSTWVTARNEYKYDFYSMGWNGDFNDPITFLELFVTDNGYAKFMGGFSDPEYDALIAEAKTCQDDAKRLELYGQAETILMDKGGVIPLYFTTNQMYYQSYVSGLSTPMFGAEYEFSRVQILPH